MDVWWNKHIQRFGIIQLKQPFINGCLGFQVWWFLYASFSGCLAVLLVRQNPSGRVRDAQRKSAKVGRADASANCLPAECWELGACALPSMRLRARPWKSMVGRCFFWGSLFFGCYISFRDGKKSSFLSSVNAARNFEIMLRRIWKIAVTGCW